MSVKSRGGGVGGGAEKVSRSVISKKWTLFLCIGSFCAGMFFTNRMWRVLPESQEISITPTSEDEGLKLGSQGCDTKYAKYVKVSKGVFGEDHRKDEAIKTLDKTISSLEMELAAAKAAQGSILGGGTVMEDNEKSGLSRRRKYFMVVGINTAFSSRKRRDSVRATWMPQGEKRKKLEEEKGIIIRFVIGHGAMSGGILDRAIDAEDSKHGDFLRLDHVEGYLELSAKTRTYFATAVKLWDAEYYIKVDDDVHVNIGTLGETLARHRKKPRVYIGCMKSGPVLSQKGVRYHEPEYWKFGDNGNKYFRHATGQLYAISKDLATYISVNQHVLHKFANEDVSLGSWFIGLDVQHIDDRRLCCGTPPDCEWKAQAGNICVASFDWTCSGICRSVDRIKEVHRRCGEGEKALWNASF
ncbi:probable beta-1,3-galactosyltransferase 2 [Ipomoea triloba]|uniref:probable beta-1,3-galactosyltransferase 2 n=1 Tax=Ipomoea triloba TaxID=35885 RepID=UPI00125D6BAC|nr:probable beta-1,3-galactosyltransferase 2 [Ipomoea triloba]